MSKKQVKTFNLDTPGLKMQVQSNPVVSGKSLVLSIRNLDGVWTSIPLTSKQLSNVASFLSNAAENI